MTETNETAELPAIEAPIGDIESTATEVAPIHESRGPDAHGWFRGTGRRKTAVARVRLKPGSGEFQIRGRVKPKSLEHYFTETRDRDLIRGVLKNTDTEGKVDVYVNCNGGGFMGQAGAIVLGLGRALRELDPNLESILRENNYLTRDARKVERKKYGQAGARKRFQFSKR
jgi:small subunit ribosomal protein S9